MELVAGGTDEVERTGASRSFGLVAVLTADYAGDVATSEQVLDAGVDVARVDVESRCDLSYPERRFGIGCELVADTDGPGPGARLLRTITSETHRTSRPDRPERWHGQR